MFCETPRADNHLFTYHPWVAYVGSCPSSIPFLKSPLQDVTSGSSPEFRLFNASSITQGPFSLLHTLHSNKVFMSCALGNYPMTGFPSDHLFSDMSNRRSPSPQRRREETFLVRSVLPSREPSKEDIELAQHLIGHAQGTIQRVENGQSATNSPSPNYEANSPESSSPSVERLSQITPRSNSVERQERELSQSYPPVSSQSDSVPSGQVCR